MKINLCGLSDVYYIGGDDKDIDLFENQYRAPDGISYNSYVILDDKCVVMDTADERITDMWFENLDEVLGDRKPDYLVISHMEPDHSANVENFLEKYPDTILVVNAKTIGLLEQFFGKGLEYRSLLVKEGDTLSLGHHELQFIMAPMVHWPEVMVTYDRTDKILFSADVFGNFGALNGDICGRRENWEDEAARYYINIVGKFGTPVSNLLKKLDGIDVEMIAPLHGPVLNKDLERYIRAYKNWSSYTSDVDGTLVVYASLHGNTGYAARELYETLEEKGEKADIIALSRDDISGAVAKAFRYSKLVLMSATYDGDIMPVMHDYLYRLSLKGCCRKRVGLVENGSWGPAANRKMRDALSQMKEMEILEPTITIRTCMTQENKEELKKLAENIASL
ncbi:MAG: FprA family A-type flavoprotein [Clostridiales bacterium]|nr:FprA family A-type flavoprotein [Clostridiales bacterium]MBS5878387.1 FprA family A-type flavoprotein [Clostridiales bacterium]MDU0939829.1 FprA family A-type flavoprotein [Clostridiales bacterium]MDU1042673.1 FprA family A-type flavoprotein [Clostridiales bacterium]